MTWIALIAWIATAAGGSVLGASWVRHGGLRQRSGIRTARLASHVLLAVGGLALWVAFLVTDAEALAWTAVALLVVVVGVGISMLILWLRGHSATGHTELPAETSFPLPVILAHGLLGATTLLTSALAAAGMG
jgi:hypothetical protein